MKKRTKKSLLYPTMKIKLEIACHKVNIFITRNDTFHFFFFRLICNNKSLEGKTAPLFIYNNQNCVCVKTPPTKIVRNEWKFVFFPFILFLIPYCLVSTSPFTCIITHLTHPLHQFTWRVSPQGVDCVTRQPFFVKWFFVWSRKFSNPSTTPSWHSLT